MNPNASINIPINGQPSNTITNPTTNNTVPFHFFLWKKKETVLRIPITRVTPPIKSNCKIMLSQLGHVALTFPIARSALSKNMMIPKKIKNIPNNVRPMPISVVGKH
jgi:hypothetical protein